MEIRKRTEITVETDEVLTIRRARVYRAWCVECGREVEMVGLLDARAIAGLPGNVVCPAKWHVQEEQGSALVCMESVLRSVEDATRTGEKFENLRRLL